MCIPTVSQLDQLCITTMHAHSTTLPNSAEGCFRGPTPNGLLIDKALLIAQPSSKAGWTKCGVAALEAGGWGVGTVLP